VYISPTRGDAPLKPIATKFGNLFYLTNVINVAKFDIDWYVSFGSGEVQNVPFPMRTKTGLITAALPSLQVPPTVVHRTRRSGNNNRFAHFSLRIALGYEHSIGRTLLQTGNSFGII